MEKRFIDPPDIAVDEKQCARCGLCAKICPTRIFDPPQGSPPKVHHTEECVLCGQCLCGCPTGSIRHSGFIISNFKRIRPERPVYARNRL